MSLLRGSALNVFSFTKSLPWFLIYRRLHKEVVEERIPVPWGFIAGKRWGKASTQPILALHGLFDNAASFDKLIPLLDSRQTILAIDMPGFGKSSHPPPGLSPNFYEIILWLRYLIKQTFKWEKVTFLGHSFGSNLAFNYAGIFPEDVDKYISIDCSKINMASKPEYLLDDLRKGYGGITLKTLQIPEEGTYDVFLNYMLESREKAQHLLNKESCEIILSRELEKVSENHYRSNIDRRIHLKYIARPSLSFLEALSKKIKCEVLAIRATDGVINQKRLEFYEKHIDNIKKNSPKVVSKIVKGRHHVHLENPEEVSILINEFLS